MCVYNLLAEIGECNGDISRKDSSGGGAQQNGSRNQGQGAAFSTIFTIIILAYPPPSCHSAREGVGVRLGFTIMKQLFSY